MIEKRNLKIGREKGVNRDWDRDNIGVCYRQYYLWDRSSDHKRDGSTRCGNKTQDLDRFEPFGGGNTIRPTCGYVILVLGYCVIVFRGIGCLRGVPLPALYARGAGLHDGVLVSYRVGVLVGYNCTSSI